MPSSITLIEYSLVLFVEIDEEPRLEVFVNWSSYERFLLDNASFFSSSPSCPYFLPILFPDIFE
jgi:hypothetical protein